MSAATWKTNASTVSDVPMRAQRYRGRADGRASTAASAASSSARMRVIDDPDAPDAPTPTSSRTGAASFALAARSDRRARSTAYAMNARA